MGIRYSRSLRRRGGGANVNRLLLVMGVQRSGTTALAESIAQDPSLYFENEKAEGDFYADFLLRPKADVARLLELIHGRVLLKPLSETYRRSVDDVLDEYSEYSPRLAWIFRDPIDVWQSWRHTFGTREEELEAWINDWNARNRSALESLRGLHASAIRIVSYEDLLVKSEVFVWLCQFLQVHPRVNLFSARASRDHRVPPPDEFRRRIQNETRMVLAELHEHKLAPVTQRAPLVASRNISAGTSNENGRGSETERSAFAAGAPPTAELASASDLWVDLRVFDARGESWRGALDPLLQLPAGRRHCWYAAVQGHFDSDFPIAWRLLGLGYPRTFAALNVELTSCWQVLRGEFITEVESRGLELELMLPPISGIVCWTAPLVRPEPFEPVTREPSLDIARPALFVACIAPLMPGLRGVLAAPRVVGAAFDVKLDLAGRNLVCQFVRRFPSATIARSAGLRVSVTGTELLVEAAAKPR